ncbi:MAG: RHS repeat-associated core domain-containing protein, partial [Chloroflexi bacterium CFX1]|nr:RHS repeat-associated core domain-containing protein [Chloroflexi bacterium CFX1]
SVIGNAAYVSNMDYDSAGRLLTRALGNGLTQTYNYYAWNQQGGRLHTLVTGSLQNITYQYDSVGNITQIANSIASETSVYDYDALDRLTSWQLNQDTPETYIYDPTTGNLDQKAGLDLQYLDSNHVHAVTNANSNTYAYDANGNQTTRHIGNDTFHLIYDAENRLVEVKKNVTTIAEFTFDGDGKRVMSVIDGETIRFVGGYYERKGSEITKYYMAGAARVAMRKYTIPQSMTVEYMLGDHLGSTSVTTDSNGAMISEMRYKPWGELRYTWTNAPANTSPAYELTRYQYTGQYSYDVEFGLKYYGARFYDSATGHFVSADTVIPEGTQGYDRYAYVYNNPLRYNDPTGHEPGDMCDRGYEEYCDAETLETYTMAGIETVSPSLFGTEINYRPPWVVAIATFFGNDSVSEGRAKLYPEEVEELGIDPQTPEGAFLGMQERISDRIKACTGCSETGKLIVAALGSDKNFSVKDVQLATANKYALDSGSTTIDWKYYLQDTSGGSYSKYASLIRTFASNVQELQSQGHYVPGGVNFNYIQSILYPSMFATPAP